MQYFANILFIHLLIQQIFKYLSTIYSSKIGFNSK